MLGPYVSQLELMMHNHPNLVKGMNLDVRASKLTFGEGRNAGLLNFNSYLETDYSRFDLSISSAYIKLIERLFLGLAYAHDDVFVEMLPWLENSRGINDLGLTYLVEGTRCSGDAHTSIGNGLINHFNTWLAMSELPDDTWCSYHEGDDGIIGVVDGYHDQAAYNLHIMPCLGFQLKLDAYFDIGDTTFCGRFLYNEESLVASYCDVRRTLAKFHTICSDGDPEALLLAKMISYYHTDHATPVVGVLATVIIHLLLPKVSERRLQRAIAHLSRDYWFRQKMRYDLMFRCKYVLTFASPGVRAAVARRCGMSVVMQQKFECYYISWLKLGHIPSSIDKIQSDWTFKDTMHVHGSPCDWVA